MSKPFLALLPSYNKALDGILLAFALVWGRISKVIPCPMPHQKSVSALPDQLDSFLTYLRVTRSRSRNTSRNAKSILTRFVQFLADQGFDSLTDVSLSVVLKFLDRFASPAYRYVAIYFLRLFFDFAQVPVNPARQVKFPKINPSAKVRFIERTVLIRLLQILQQHVQEGRHSREYALVLLLLFTGIRADEALALRKEDILTSGVMMIRDSKTHTSRVSRLPAEVLKAIAAYHQAHPNADNPYVFYANTKHTLNPLSYSTLRAIIKRLFSQAGLDRKGVNLHSLRHSFSRSLVEGGFSREEIQKFLGHKNIQTTEIYTRLSDRDILQRVPTVHRIIRRYLPARRVNFDG